MDLRKNPKLVVIGVGLLLVASIVTAYFVSQGELFRESEASEELQTQTLAVPGKPGTANQDGTQVTQSNFWIGNAASPDQSYLGLIFEGVDLPDQDFVVESAVLQLVPSQDAWISVTMDIHAEDTLSPAPFSGAGSVKNVNSRALTEEFTAYDENVKWVRNETYSIDVTDAVKNHLEENKDEDLTKIALILKGAGQPYGRKSVNGSGSAKAPKLVLTYRLLDVGSGDTGGTTGDTGGTTGDTTGDTGGTTGDTTGDTGGTTGDTTGTTGDTTTGGTTGTTTGGTTGTTGGTTTGGTTGGSTPVPTPISKWGVDLSLYSQSVGWGTWTPSQYDTCSQELHNAYSIIGPDGKVYHTWHPAIDPTTNCKFGHEHGDDPRSSDMFDKLATNYAYDANANGTISAAEKATSGVPFGYVNEQLDSYNGGSHGHRREDHFGHKVFAYNNVQLSLSFPVASGNKVPINVYCDYFNKQHQGAHSQDAFVNAVHELIYAADCDGEHELILSVFSVFGANGEFSESPPCEPRGAIVRVPGAVFDTRLPGDRSRGFREIGTRRCVETEMLVPPDGSEGWSGDFYEIWTNDFRIERENASAGDNGLVHDISLSFAIFDPTRYFYPGKPNNIGYSHEICGETFNGRRTRGGWCDFVDKTVPWNHPDASMKSIRRETYFKPAILDNQGGEAYWYTDPFGKNAIPESTWILRGKPAGYLRQRISTIDVDFGRQYGGSNGALEPEAVGKERCYDTLNNLCSSNTSNGVHAPN